MIKMKRTDKRIPMIQVIFILCMVVSTALFLEQDNIPIELTLISRSGKIFYKYLCRIFFSNILEIIVRKTKMNYE